MRKQWTLVAAVLGVGLITTAAPAGDWAQFLGPNRDAKSPETGLLERWPDGGPEQVWRRDVGPGFGGAAVKDGRVFILDRVMGQADVLRCLDRKSGEELWHYRYKAEGRLSHNGSRSTPTVTDKYVYTVGGFGHLHCISRETHEPVWSVELNDHYKEGSLKWGFAQSPLLYKGTVIVAPVHEDSPGLVALERDTGEVVWESEAFGGDYYCSPIIREVAGRQGVMITTQTDTFFVDPDNGETIWQYEGYDVRWSIPAPTVLPDGRRIFITGGYDAGSVMIKVHRRGDEYAFEELFRLEEGSQIHPAIHHEGYLYANINENSNLKGKKKRNGGLACIDPDSGEILWRTGADPNFNRGNVMLAEGKLIALDGENGELHLVEPSPEKFKPISHFVALEPKRKRGNKIWAPMALSDGLLIVRDQQEMKCFNLRADAYAKAKR